MTRKSKVRYNRFRTYRLKVNPTTRAIRSAILGLAVAGAAIPVANAGTCTFSAPATYDCEGVFNNTITYAVDDLTVTLGTSVFAVVTPPNGFDGLDLSDAGAGYVDLTTDAASVILTYYGTAISVNADTIDINSSGSIVSTYGDGIATDSVYDTTIVSGGAIDVLDAGAAGTGYNLTGIFAYSHIGNVDITQAITGSITSVTTNGPGAASTGIEAVAFYYASVGVNGAISAITAEGSATGVQDLSFVGNANVTISQYGDISAVVGDALGYDAFGVHAQSTFGIAGITNDGSVEARTYGYGQSATGLGAAGYYNAGVVNSLYGTVNAYARGDSGNAVGVSATASAPYGYASIYNGGAIYASADNSLIPSAVGNVSATGAAVSGTYAFATNGGDIHAQSYTYNGSSSAIGVQATSSLYSRVNNSYGHLGADAYSMYGNSMAVGAYLNGPVSKYSGSAGSIDASAGTYRGNADAIGARVGGSYTGFTAYGSSIDVNADVYGSAGPYTASAIGIRSTGTSNQFVNVKGGTLDVTANNYGVGQSTATGISMTGGNYRSSIYSSADINVDAYTYYGSATATGISLNALDIGSVTNAGFIDATAEAGGAYAAFATGVSAINGYNSLNFYNSGDIYANAFDNNGAAYATGSYVHGYVYAYTDNIGHIEAYASSGNGGNAYATGSATITDNGTANTFNSGYSMIATANAGDFGFALAQASVDIGSGYTHTINNGLMAAYANALYHGYAYAFGSQTTSTTYVAAFDGGIGSQTLAYADTGDYGLSKAYALTVGGVIYGGAQNSGDIFARATTTYGGHASAYGAQINSGGGFANVDNDYYGSIGALATAGNSGYAHASAVEIDGHNGASMYNDGYVGATATAGDHGYASASGVHVGSSNGSASFSGYGDVNSYAHAYDYSTANASGVSVLANLGADAFVEYYSYVTAEAMTGYQGASTARGLTVGSLGYAYAHVEGHVYATTSSGAQGTSISTGVVAYSIGGDAALENGGRILATASSGDGSHVYATGADIAASGTAYLRNYGYTVARATAGNDSYAYAYGAYVTGADALVTGDNVLGAVTHVSDNSIAYATGAYVHATTGNASLVSDLSAGLAYAGDASEAIATGAYVLGAVDASASVFHVLAGAYAGDNSRAFAVGIQVYADTGNGYGALTGNQGDVHAYVGDHSQAYAYGILVDANVDAAAHVGPARFIVEAESGDYGLSIAGGLVVDGTATGYAYNYGAIYALAFSGYQGGARATGASVSGDTYAGMRNYFAMTSGRAVVGDSGTARAYGVDVAAGSGLATLYSYGILASDAEAGNAYGANFAFAVARTASVYSANGDASAYTYYEVNGFASVGDNYGAGASAFATGIDVESGQDNAYLHSGADIIVTARAGSYASAIAEGVIVDGYTFASAHNYGLDSTYAYATDHSGATAVAMQVYSSNGDAYFYNDGTVQSAARVHDHSSAYAIGSSVFSNGYDATLYNIGEIHAYADSGFQGTSTAKASIVDAGQAGVSYMTNFGYSLVAHSYAGDGGSATATASTVVGGVGANSYNHGLIEAVAGVGIAGQATATGSLTQSAGGNAYLYSDGMITADAFGLGASVSKATGAIVDGNVDATADNYGYIGASASTGDLGTANAVGANLYAHTGIADFYNDGYVYAQASAGNGVGSAATAFGTVVYGAAGASLHGFGTVDAQADAGTSGSAVAVGASVSAGAGTVDVSMYSFQIDATAGDYGYAHALGVNASSVGDAAVSIYGDSHAYASAGKYGTAIAQGVIVDSSAGYANFDNLGEINVRATSAGKYDLDGGTAVAQGATVSGFLDASAYSPGAIYAEAFVGAGGSASALGIAVHSDTGDSYLYNGTGIHAYAHGKYVNIAQATAANVYGYVDATVQGDGNFAAGAISEYGSSAYAVNVTAHSGDAFLYSGSYVSAGASVGTSGNAIAHGATVYGYNNADAYIVGTVDANASSDNSQGGSVAQAVGVNVYANAGNAYLYAGNHVYAHAQSYGDATAQAIAATVYGYVNADVVVYGDVNASASVSYGTGGTALATGMQVTAHSGDATLYDDGHIYATASSDYQGFAQALSASVYGYNNASAYVNETISAFAQSGNQGFAQATGISVNAAHGDAFLYVGGNAGARAIAGYGGVAVAQGATVYGFGYADAYVQGTVGAYASVGYGTAQAHGIDVTAHSADAYLYIDGSLYATALAGDNSTASAQGAFVSGYNYASAYIFGGTNAQASAGDTSLVQARGIDLTALHEDAYLNSGYVYASATAGDASTAIAQGAYVLGYNYSTARVYGNVDAYASAGDNSGVQARGIDVVAQHLDANLYTTGDVYATALAGDTSTALAQGAYVNGYVYATSHVGGNISAFASAGDASTASARGIDVIAQNGDAYFYDGGYVYATALAGYGSIALAQGVNVLGYNYATAKLYYGISAIASAEDGASAGGIDVVAQHADAYLSAGGGIFASASSGDNSTALAHGAYVAGYGNAYAYVGNTINAIASAGDNSVASARGIDVVAQNGDATLGVYYNIYATASAGDNSTAQAIGANVSGAGYATANVVGSIDAEATSGDTSTSQAFGILVSAASADAYLYTAGDITAHAYSGDQGISTAVGAQVTGFEYATAIIDGGFDVYALSGDFGQSLAVGISVTATHQDAFLSVGAPLYASAVSGDNGTAVAQAADVNGYKYATALTNGIDAYAYSGYQGNSTAIGITVDATKYDAVLHDYYGLSATAISGYSGTSVAQAAAVTGYTYAIAHSDGDIYAGAITSGDGAATAIGITVNADIGGAYLGAYGDIIATAMTGYNGTATALGASVHSNSKYATAVIDGLVDVYAYSGDNGVSSAQGVNVTAPADSAFLRSGYGIDSSAISGDYGVSAARGGYVHAYDYATAYVSGPVSAYADSGYRGVSQAAGMDVAGRVAVLGTYDLSAIAISGDYGVSLAYGARVIGTDYAGMGSYGNTYAGAISGFYGVSVADGVYVDSSAGDAYLGHYGQIIANAYSGYHGMSLAQAGNVQGYGYAHAYTYANIRAYAESGDYGVSAAGGMNVHAINGDAYLLGTSIAAFAYSGYHGTSQAAGVYVASDLADASAILTGGSGAVASSGDYGVSQANGVFVEAPTGAAYLYSGYNAAAYAISKYKGVSIAHAADVSGYTGATAYSFGEVNAVAYSGEYGLSAATGITVTSANGDALLVQGNDISVSATSGDYGLSVADGAYVNAQYNATAYTDNGVYAFASSGIHSVADASAIGVHSANADAYLYAYGPIKAVAYAGDYSVAQARGADVVSDNYDAFATSIDSVYVSATAGISSVAAASGVSVTASNGNAYLYDGSIYAYALVSDQSVAVAHAATVAADGYAYATSSGYVVAGAYAGDYSVAAAYGFSVTSANGYAYLYNGSRAYATAIAGYQSVAHAEGSSVVGLAGATTINPGHIEAYAYAGDMSVAYALGSETLSSAGNAYLYNSGNSIIAVAIAGDNSTATANASVVYGALDSTTISSGYIYAYAYSGTDSVSSALGNATTAGTGYAYLYSSGSIYAGAVSGYSSTATATGSYVAGPLGATTQSYADIVAYAATGDYGVSDALGSTTVTSLGYGYLYNGGYIGATAVSGYQGDSYARGVLVNAPYGAGAVSPGDVYTLAYVGDDGSAEAHGMRVLSSQDYAYLNAGGDVTTSALGGEFGVSSAYGTETNGYLGAYTRLGGNVVTRAVTGDYGQSTAYGSVTTSADGYAYLRSDSLIGTYASSGYDSQSVAIGAYVKGYDGADGLNYGDIYTGAYVGDASSATAEGVIIHAVNGYASLYTYGTVYTTAQAGADSTAVAIGTDVDGPDGATTGNYGAITTVATAGYDGAAVAFGSITNSNFGSAYLNNGGPISSYAYGPLSAVAQGSIVSGYIDAYTTNSSDIYAVAISNYGGAVAIGAQTTSATDNAGLYTAGNIGASAAGYSGALAMGSLTVGVNVAYTYNYGDIYALAYAFDGDATAMGSQTLGYVAYTGDNGSISAGAYTQYGDANATGALTVGTPYAQLFGGGDIYANAVTYIGDATATGAVTVSAANVNAYNGGNIAAYAYTYDGTAMATGAYTKAPGYATFETDGYLGAVAISINGAAVAFGGYTQGYVATSTVGGDVYASAYSYADYAGATGIYNAGNWSYVYNNGSSITAQANSVSTTAIARGITAYGTYYSYVGGDSDILATATSYDNAIAIGLSSSTYDGDSYVTLGGSVGAYAYAAYGQALAQGISNSAGGAGHAEVDNSADITAQAFDGDGAAFAFGIDNYAYSNSAIVDNSGVIYAIADADGGTAVATGILSYAPGDESHISNSGAVAANATAYDGTAVATGSRALGYYYTSTDNAGTIIGTADVGDGPDGIAMATGSSTVSQAGDANLYNGGVIGAYAYGGYYARATGASVYGQYGANAENYVTVTATAINGGTALATGLLVDGVQDDAGAYNHGLVQAYASGDIAAATGISVTSENFSAYMENSGQVNANAYGDSYAAARAAVANGYGYAFSYNAGTIHAYASSGGTAIAIGSITQSDTGDAALYNYDLIEAVANGYEAFAYGAFVDGYTGSSTYNAGTIVATSTATATEDGYYSMAIGLSANSDDGDVTVLNYGSIVANAYGAHAEAIGVRMTGNGYGTLYNAGTIAAYGDGMRRAIQGGAYLSAYIVNSGDVIGSVGTGNYNDSLFNMDGGYWVALQSSDFGDGDDTIVNEVGGVIVMPNSAIYMGGYSADGNAFYNYGTIVVMGDSLIDMGGNYTLAPGANPLPFYNSGTITMVDGHPDDSLTINGDFTGVGGDLDVDVSLSTGDADRLYITGNAVDPTSQTINIALTGKPTVANEFVPIVDVNDAQDGDWVLGTVTGVPNNLFYDLDLAIVHKAGTPDEFGLGIDVSGLNAKGLAALGIGPALQSAWNAINGTLFQREGTDREGRLQGFALSGRVFKNDGKLDPKSGDTDMGTADDRKINADTSGGEVGLAYNFNDAWSIGVLLSTQKLDIDTAGGGNSNGNDNGWGAYATWSPGAFYADLIYREMGFDLKANTAAGGFREKGTSSGWSLEMGYAFVTDSGWKIEPQAQYSSMTIDGLDDITSGWGNWSYENTDSTRLRLGVAFRKTFVTDEQHSWTPYLSINEVDEMDGDNTFKIDNGVFFGGDDTSGNSTLVELGATGRINNWTVFGGLNFQEGGGYRNTMGGQLGVRYTFAQPAPAPAVAPPPAKTCADLDDDGDGVNNCDDKCLGSTAGQAVGPDGCPVPLTIDLKGVNFDFDKATLRPDAVALLDEAAAILTKYPDLKVEVAGHTDSIGTEQYNQGLSERRAQAVYDYLGQHGVDAGRMVGPNGYGETRPIAPNTNEDGSDNPEGRAKNRRTELNVQN